MNELIRILQEREDVSFEEAQYYIKKANGDVDKAVYLIQKRRNSLFYRSSQSIKEILESFWRYRIIICRTDKIFVNVPLFVLLLFLLVFDRAGLTFGFFVSFLLMGIILSGSELMLTKPESPKMSIPAGEVFSHGVPNQKGYDLYQTRQSVNVSDLMQTTDTTSVTMENNQTQLNDYSEIIIK